MAPDVEERVRECRVDAEHRHARPARVIDEQKNRSGDADDQRREHIEHEHARKCDHTEPEFLRRERVEGLHLADPHQVRDRVDDERAQYRFGQVLEERSQRDHGHDTEHGRDER